MCHPFASRPGSQILSTCMLSSSRFFWCHTISWCVVLHDTKPGASCCMLKSGQHAC
jgi:hypothetical protein